jgi:CRISPR-associated protein Csb2
MHVPNRSELSVEDALCLYRRLLERDPVAPADFAVAYLKPLIAWLHSTNPGVDPMTYDEAAGEAIIRFLSDPTKYDPQRLEVEAFLRMAAQRDLQNLLRKERRHQKNRRDWKVVEQASPDGKYLGRDDDPSLSLQIEEARQRQGLPTTMRQQLTDVEQRFWDQMQQGERRHSVFAEAFRHALMGQFQRQCHRQKYGHARKPYQELFHSPLLSGKDADGQLMQQHRHAFFLPTAEGSDPRRITHVTVAAAGGFGTDEVSALNALRMLKGEDDLPDLRVQLVGLGVPQDFRAELLGESTVWISATPFLVTRYPKLRGAKRDRPEDYASLHDFVRHVLQQELQRRAELPALRSIEEEATIGPQRLRPIQFKRFRQKQGDDGGRRPAGGFRLTFTAPVRGPLCLGHSCHFGLGLFVPPSPTSPRAER